MHPKCKIILVLQIVHFCQYSDSNIRLFFNSYHPSIFDISKDVALKSLLHLCLGFVCWFQPFFIAFLCYSVVIALSIMYCISNSRSFLLLKNLTYFEMLKYSLQFPLKRATISIFLMDGRALSLEKAIKKRSNEQIQKLSKER